MTSTSVKRLQDHGAKKETRKLLLTTETAKWKVQLWAVCNESYDPHHFWCIDRHEIHTQNFVDRHTYTTWLEALEGYLSTAIYVIEGRDFQVSVKEKQDVEIT